MNQFNSQDFTKLHHARQTECPPPESQFLTHFHYCQFSCQSDSFFPKVIAPIVILRYLCILTCFLSTGIVAVFIDEAILCCTTKESGLIGIPSSQASLSHLHPHPPPLGHHIAASWAPVLYSSSHLLYMAVNLISSSSHSSLPPCPHPLLFASLFLL